MKIRNSTSAGNDKIDIQMTPMIDIVFQLLIFFIMTFKIVAVEGDFSIKMPQAPSPGNPDPNLLPPIKLRMTASPDGELANIMVGSRSFGRDFDALRGEIIGIVGTGRGPGSVAESAEVEIDSDYNLQYGNVIQAITAVSGYIEGNKTIKLIEKIKFARLRQR